MQFQNAFHKTSKILTRRQIRSLPSLAKTTIFIKKSAVKGAMSSWKLRQLAKAQIKNPVLIEGLPGMGNVGKIAVDYLIDAFKAEKLYELTSNELPHCVFVNEDNLVELPKINIYYKNTKDRTLLFLAGDIQPISESSCFDFCNTILDTFEKGRGKEIITLGGIALPRVPKNPKIYCTGNSKKIVNKYKSHLVNTNIHGVVGPIVGVSGLLTGLAGRKNIPAITLLAETFGHPNYLGIKGARNILKVLKEQLKLNLELSDLDEEVSEIEQEIARRTSQVAGIDKITKKKASIPPLQEVEEDDTDYIG